jgi:hypothetical protein
MSDQLRREVWFWQPDPLPAHYEQDKPEPIERHTLIWGELRVTDYDVVEWFGENYMVVTDHEPYGDHLWADLMGGSFAACLEAGLERTPDNVICACERDFAHVSIVGRVERLYVDAQGLLYAEVCTGIIEVTELLEHSVVLYRGYPRTDGFLEEDGDHLLFCLPQTIMLLEPVGHIKQVTKVEDVSDLDMDVWGDVLN